MFVMSLLAWNTCPLPGDMRPNQRGDRTDDREHEPGWLHPPRLREEPSDVLE
jgi:hypothetical protein